TDFASAHLVAERVREGIAGIQIRLHEGGRVTVAASVGLAVCPANGISAQELVAAADRALYVAKRGGRNRVCGSLTKVLIDLPSDVVSDKLFQEILTGHSFHRPQIALPGPIPQWI